MVTHFSTLGLPLKSPDDFRELAAQVVKFGQTCPCPGGSYVYWKGDWGAELWVQLDHEGRFLDIQPHFASMSAMRIGITKRLNRPTDMPLDGAWQGWLDPIDDDDPASGRCEVTFEAPDFALHHELSLPVLASVQLAAFAHQVTVFETEQAFCEAPQTKDRLNPQSFIPAQQRVRDGGETEPQLAEALVCGHILKSELLCNDLTGLPFYWLLLETTGGRLDLLVDPVLMPSASPTGGIVMTVCWLSGRIL